MVNSKLLGQRCLSWRRLVALFVLLQLMACASVGQDVHVRKDKVEKTLSLSELDFSSTIGRRIVVVRLILKQYRDLFRENDSLPTVDIEVRDEETLKRVSRAFSFAWQPVQFRYSNTEALSLPYGELVVTTGGDSFTVYIYDNGFVVGTKECTTEKRFFSWTLARVVDDLQFQQSKQRLSKERIDHLSGESIRTAEKRDTK